jgi:hypothetical protein
MYFRKLVAAATVALALGAVPAFAANVDVQLLNKGDAGSMVFQPDLIKVNVGDTVRGAMDVIATLGVPIHTSDRKNVGQEFEPLVGRETPA